MHELTIAINSTVVYVARLLVPRDVEPHQPPFQLRQHLRAGGRHRGRRSRRQAPIAAAPEKSARRRLLHGRSVGASALVRGRAHPLPDGRTTDRSRDAIAVTKPSVRPTVRPKIAPG